MRDVWFAWVPFQGARVNHPAVVVGGPHRLDDADEGWICIHGTSTAPADADFGGGLLFEIDPREWPETGLAHTTYFYRTTICVVRPQNFVEPRAGFVPIPLWNVVIQPAVEALKE